MASTSLARIIAAACLAWAASGAAQLADGERTFEWSADVLDSDFRSDTLELSGNVLVREGDMSITAQGATATDVGSNHSRWRFRDGVHIRTAQADLQSDVASASIIEGEIVEARVEGAPARFEQRGESADRQVRGRAGVIEYDFRTGVVRLENDVWFSNGKDEFRGDVVIYNVRDERVQINPGGAGGRVRGVIRPGAVKSDVKPSPPQPEDGNDS